MKKSSALAVLEFVDIPAGVFAVDAILKKAPINFVRAGTVTRGRYLVVFGGSTAATAESLGEALAVAGGAVLDHAFLPDVHQSLFDALFGNPKNIAGSVLVIETETASSVVRSVEAALKGTGVELIDLRLSDSGLAGKGVALMIGTLHEIEAAAALASSASGSGGAIPRGFRYRLIAAPHDVLERDMTAAARFESAPLLELDGEPG